MSTHVAVDLGASSGRVMTGSVGRDRLVLTEAARFRNGAVAVTCDTGTDLHWDVLGLWQDVVAGLAAAGRATGAGDPERPVSVGIDTWAVDYALLDEAGRLLGTPRSYRDRRTDGVADRVHAGTSAEQLYARNGLQHLPFTTMFQLVAEASGPLLGSARTLLLMPDLFAYWLTGYRGAESSNTSTTGLADVRTGRWAEDLVALTGVPPGLFPPVHDAGAVLSGLSDDVVARTGLPGAVVTAVGTHDTASAVVAVPARDEHFAYIVCGTWGLVGVELDTPVLTEASRDANFTNERGVDGRVRYLRNVTGLWVLQGCLADWRGQGQRIDLPELLAQAAALPSGGPGLDVGDIRLQSPGPMVSRVRALAAERGRPLAEDPVAVTRAVLESLATAFAAALGDASRLSGLRVDTVHLVGGGAQNELLCQLTADACGTTVAAGPVEATALGNVLVQARTHGTLSGSLEDLRSLVRRTHQPRLHHPRLPSTRPWSGPPRGNGRQGPPLEGA